MKMGVALLDPAARTAVNTLVGSNEVHADFTDRPADFGDPETIKVVVLMTDGENTNQYDVRQPYKRGFSTIHYHVDDDRYSVYVAVAPITKTTGSPTGNPTTGPATGATSPTSATNPRR
jgi:hypothetical protein